MRPVLLVKPFAILDKFPQGGLPPLFLPDFGVDKQGEPPPVSSGVFIHGLCPPVSPPRQSRSSQILPPASQWRGGV